MLNRSDKKNYIKRYNERLNKFGYNSKTLGWKGGYRKQKKRFCELLKICAFSSKSVKSILDVDVVLVIYLDISANIKLMLIIMV